MLTLASDTAGGVVVRSRPEVQAAHFDVAIVSGEGGRQVQLLADGLAVRSANSVLMKCAGTGISPRLDTGHRPDPVFYTSMKLLCLEDRLFDREGGCDFVRSSVAAARRAGRMTALLCTDLQTVFTKRQEIAASFGGAFDIVVGKPAEVLTLFGVKRIDTLVPKLAQLGTGLILHRIDFPPIHLRPRGTSAKLGDAPISATSFWSQFVPAAFDELTRPGQRTD